MIATAQQPKVSIIVPVCNVQDYLEQCLEAVLAQTLEDIEVIALDDGSTDSSPEILARFARADNRLRVITKQNEGYGATINRGFAEARADYVGIVESDDWPEPDMFEKLYGLVEKTGCDIAKCDFYSTYEDHEDRFFNFRGLPAKKPLNAMECPQLMLITPSTWTALYRKRFLEDNGIWHRETPGASFQDASFSLKCLYAAQSIVLLNEPLMHYRCDNPGASMKSAGKLFAVADEFQSAREFFAGHPDRYARLIPWARLNEWHCYRWEYERVAPEGRVAFMERVEREMKEASAAGELDFGLFTAEEGERCKLLLSVGATRFCAMLPTGFYHRCVLHEGMPEVADEFLVTIVITAYNAESFIERSVKSCLRQTHGNIQVVCVDDCSSDATLAKLRELALHDARLTVVPSARNAGEHDARLAGVREARGHLVLFLDADDELKPLACERAVAEYLAAPYDILQFAAEVRGDGRISARKVREMADWLRPDDDYLVGPEIVNRCFVEHACCHNSCLKAYERRLVQEAFEAIGSFRADSGVDGLEYFAIAMNATVYRGAPSARCYVYHLGSGMSSREGMTYSEFARSVEGARALAGMKLLLERTGHLDEWAQAYEGHCAGQAGFVMRTWFEDVRDDEKPRCLKALLENWDRGLIVDAACDLGSEALAYLRDELGDDLELTARHYWKCGYADGRRDTRDEYEQSGSYRLGRLATAVPRRLAAVFRR